MEKIRWGLVSTAHINRRVIPAIRASERGELAAVASRKKRAAQNYAKRWDIQHAFGGYEEMLESDAIDAVYVSLPNHLHAAWSIKAMQAGKHVLCEKPFAISLEEVDAMIATSKETERVLAEAFMYRHHPQTKLAGKLVRNGKVGDVLVVRGVFNFAMSDPKVNVRMVPEYGGGSLWDVGVYPLSFAQFIMGETPQKVFGDQWVGKSRVDEVFSGQMVYRGGRLTQIACSFRSPFYTHAEIIGTKGRITLSRPFTGMEDGEMLFYDADDKVERIPVPEIELYLGQIEDMHAAILDGAPNYLTLAETRNHIRTVLALYESAKTGKAVLLD